MLIYENLSNSKNPIWLEFNKLLRAVGARGVYRESLVDHLETYFKETLHLSVKVRCSIKFDRFEIDFQSKEEEVEFILRYL